VRALWRSSVLTATLSSSILACATNSPSSATGPSDASTFADATSLDNAPPSTGADSGTHDASPDAGSSGNDASSSPIDGGAIPSVDASPYLVPGADASIVAFDNTLVCFGSGGVGPCSRTVDSTVTFPTTGAFSQILLDVTLKCPSNGCDPWDRAGSIDLVVPPSEDGGAETLMELGRFMTPYGITSGVNAPPSWEIDVTELRPLMSGTVTLRVFIDTWVPQGNAAQYGGGWVVGATFNMVGGVASPNPVVVVPIWSWVTTNREPTQVIYGDPNYPISSSLPPQTLTLPAGPTTWGIRAQITGHGQANLDNCSEFCSENHTWSVGSTRNTTAIWRTDCANYPSQGTYQYSRAGWCPGAAVIPWDIDVTSQVTAGSSATFTYGVTPYLNTCNASESPDGGVCSGCASGESCAYDGSDHTQPFYYVTSVLVGFE
jgi:hypothetical protein